MARRKEVLLVQDVLKLGNMGDVVRVSPGYARNYLFPYGYAIPADGAAKRQIDVLREKAAKSEAERQVKAEAQAKTMQGLSIQVAAKVAHDDELFGSVGVKEIVSALAKSGIDIDTKQVHLHDKLRKLGRYQVEIALHKKVVIGITVEVVNSDPNAPSLDETLAQLAAMRAAKKKEEKPAEGAPAAEAKAEAPAAVPAAKSEKPEKSQKAEKKADGGKKKGKE
jgi:large subunit ribosomal protein L9